ncbi:MAG: ergothioneine biosynthesis protein EgtB, partial [Actinomycetota bacterium]
MPTTTAGISVQQFQDVRALTETIARPLSAEDQTVQSMPDVSPTKWHRAHTSWFFESFVLAPHVPGYGEFHPAFAYLFNSYYEAVGPRHARPQRGLLSRPGVAEIASYRAHVDAAMHDLLDRPVAPDVEGLVELGLHHEQQHQELMFMDIKHVLWCNPLQPAYLARRTAAADTADATDRPAGWIDHPGGLVEVGHEGGGFAFDNELPRHQAWLAPFALADRPVSCGDWLAFIDDGGYRRPELWLSDGWAIVQSEGWDAPLYWRPEGGGWTVFTLGGPKPVDAGEPVCHISYHEADAFARWAGARLASEAEWETVAQATTRLEEPFELDALHPRPSPPGSFPAGVWEWTSSAYLPYPGFRPAAGAVGEYNGKFMV